MFQVKLCESSETLQCVKNVDIVDNTCLKSCEGLYVTSYSKTELTDSAFANFWAKVEYDYNQYKAKEPIEYPSALRGIILDKISSPYCFLSGYDWKDSYKLVGIYIDTPAFDHVTKDRSAKFVDMLSAVGGTFGLLTGFSVISGVEILFFIAKFLSSLSRKRTKTAPKEKFPNCQ